MTSSSDTRWLVLTAAVMAHGLVNPRPALAQAQPKAPRLAVFDVEDKTGKLSPETRRQLTEYLSSKIAEGGTFLVIPGSQIKARLRQEKLESYKDCYDQRCQIEIGRELAAEKSLSTQISAMGAQCTVISTLYDLKRATSEESASEKSGCTTEELIASLERVARSIKTQVIAKKLPNTGGILIKSNPSGAEVFIDGTKKKGTTPLILPKLKEGEHLLLLAKGDYRHTGKIKIVANHIQQRSFDLQLTVQARERRDAILQQRVSARKEALLQVRKERRSKTIWAYSTLAAGVVCAATAGILYGVGASQGSEAHDRYRALTALPGAGNESEIGQARDDIDSATVKMTGGTVLIGAAAAAIGVSVYQFLTRPESPGDQAPEVSASGSAIRIALGRGGASVFLTASF